jgi:hypothetical protein
MLLHLFDTRRESFLEFLEFLELLDVVVIPGGCLYSCGSLSTDSLHRDLRLLYVALRLED